MLAMTQDNPTKYTKIAVVLRMLAKIKFTFYDADGEIV